MYTQNKGPLDKDRSSAGAVLPSPAATTHKGLEAAGPHALTPKLC